MVIAREELTINIRNKWTIIFATVFAILVVSMSYVGIIAAGFSGMQNFTRTSASLLNLALYIVPLVALIMGTLSFTGDKGSAELLFSQPISRAEVLLGKLFGLFTSMSMSTLVGFALAGAVVIAGAGSEGFLRYAIFVVFCLVLSLVFLGIAMLVSMLSRRRIKAFGIVMFLWFFFVIFYDLLTLGGLLMLRGQDANLFVFLSLFGNPVDLVRVASLIVLDNVSIFGAAGAAMLRFLGGAETSILVLVVALTGWVLIPILLSARLIKGQDI